MIKRLKEKSGFVLMETIIVMSILSIGLISLYSYFIIIKSKTQVNTADVNSNLYIAYQIYKYKQSTFENNSYIVISRYFDIYSEENYESSAYTLSNEEKSLYKNLKIDKIYYTNNIGSMFSKTTLDGSTLNYLQTLKNNDDVNFSSPAIIVKIRNEDNSYGFAYYQPE